MQNRTAERVIRVAGQALIITGLIYAIWSIGGVTTRAKYDMAVGSSIAMGLATVLVFLNRNRRVVPLLIPSLGCLFIAYSGMQALDQSLIFGDSKGVSQASYASDVIDTLEAGVAAKSHQLSSSAGTWGSLQQPNSGKVQVASSTQSIIPQETLAAMVPLCSAVAVMFCVAVFFETERSRQCLAAVVVANAIALVLWGFVQRSGNDAYILPGVPHTVRSIPFASFVYKNAGAACLVPALAILVGYLFFRESRRSSQNSQSSRLDRSRDGYGGNDVFEISNLIKVSILILLVAGLAISLCRGAWLSFAAASIVAIAYHQRKLPSKGQLITASIGLVAVFALVWVGGAKRSTSDRMDDLAFDPVVHNSRFERWPDGWRAAMEHFPMGAGYGTYGYAALETQRDAQASWYTHAHNQYLETFVESGLIGTAVLVAALISLVTLCIRLQKREHESSTRRWGMISLVVVISAVIQSVVDFVIIIPANFYLYAAIVGVVLACATKPLDLQQTKERRGFFKTFGHTIAASFVFVAVILSARFASQQQFAELALDATKVSKVSGPASESEIVQAIAIIDAAIERQPAKSELYRRRSHWHLIAARSAICDLAQQSGMDLPWDATHPERLFVLLQTLSEEERDGLLEELWVDERFRHSIVNTTRDLINALELSPRIPGYHISAAHLAPVLDVPTAPMVVALSPLANNDCDLLFEGGLISFLSDDTDTAVSYWQRSLAFYDKHADTIFRHALDTIAPEIIAEKLIPKSRMFTVLRLLNVDQPDQSVDHPRSEWDQESANDIGDRLTAALQRRTDISDSSRFAWTGSIYSHLGNRDLAVEAWSQAVRIDRRNTSYRYQYAVELRKIGQYQEAINQASLGAAMADDDAQFQTLIRQLRRDISPKSNVRSVSLATPKRSSR
ncbi:O-antigen ligase family protein [Rubripirellula amarantea]|nr:O-antigen ligase family protein [Rubripirellula amarantea]